MIKWSSWPVEDQPLTLSWPPSVSWSFVFASCPLCSDFGTCSPSLYTDTPFKNHKVTGHKRASVLIASFLVMIHCKRGQEFSCELYESWKGKEMGWQETGILFLWPPKPAWVIWWAVVKESSLCVLFVFSWPLDWETTCPQCVLWGPKWQCANGALSAPTQETLDLISLRRRLPCPFREAILWFRPYSHSMQHSNAFIY